MADELAFFNLPPALFTDDAYSEGVWPENKDALDAFLAISTQWRVVATAGGPLVTIGLDYQGVMAGLNLAGKTLPPEIWADVQMIEAGALGVLNRRRS